MRRRQNSLFPNSLEMKRLLQIDGVWRFLLAGVALVSFFGFAAFAQTAKGKTPAQKTPEAVSKKTPDAAFAKVTQIDLIAFKNLLKREGENAKPLLVNFWATWCDPCRAEFPDLVKIDAAYRGKIDFITISLDELSEIDRDVPKFLAEMKATMPAYLLKTGNEEEAINAVYKDWQGGLPFTILFDRKGEIAYSRQGIIKPNVLRAEIEKLLAAGENSSQVINQQIINLPLPNRDNYSYEKGVQEAERDITAGKLLIKRYGLTAGAVPKSLKKLKKDYGIEIVEHGCLVSSGFIEYVKGYNETSIAEIRRKFGDKPLELLGK